MLGFGRRSYARRARTQNAPRFVPTDLSGCVLWLRADLGITTATGVSTWADQSGHGNNFTQATGANQPGYAARGNAKGTGPALTFNGSSQVMTRATSPLANTGLHLFIVQKANATNAAICSSSWGAPVGGTGWGTTIDDNAGSQREVTAPGVAVLVDGSATTAWEAWTVSASAAPVWTMRVNGAAQALTNSGSTPAAQTAGASIGAINAGVQLWNGSIDEIIGYSRQLTALEQSQVEAYIRARTAIW